MFQKEISNPKTITSLPPEIPGGNGRWSFLSFPFGSNGLFSGANILKLGSGRKELADVDVWEIWPQNKHLFWETFAGILKQSCFICKICQEMMFVFVFSDSPSFTPNIQMIECWHLNVSYTSNHLFCFCQKDASVAWCLAHSPTSGQYPPEEIRGSSGAKWGQTTSF